MPFPFGLDVWGNIHFVNQPIFAAYNGPSMNPTLVEPAVMEVVPYVDPHAVRPGDVILFHSPEQSSALVHRVLRVTSCGIVTRGDNNSKDDAGYVQPAHIVGHVVAAQRGTQRRVIKGGKIGLTWHYVLRGWRVVNWLGSRSLSTPYHTLARAGIARKLLPARWRPRVVVFQETRLMMLGAHVIGRYDTQRGVWQIRRPFRLFVDQVELS